MDQEYKKERRSHPTAPPNDWRNLLARASSEDEVIGLVRDHLATWSPDEIARLPVECRPARVRDAEDVSQWAFELASTHCAGTLEGDAEVLLDRMLDLITQAAVRLSQLNASGPEPLN